MDQKIGVGTELAYSKENGWSDCVPKRIHFTYTCLINISSDGSSNISITHKN